MITKVASGSMSVQFSPHALEKMRRRNVKTADVKVITLYYTTKLDRLLKAKTVRGAWKRIK
jgi:hypothetical protein